MRTVKQARTALEWQVWESVMIDRLSHKLEDCMNLKREWGQSKSPSLSCKVRQPAKEMEREDQERRKRGSYRNTDSREEGNRQEP